MSQQMVLKIGGVVVDPHPVEVKSKYTGDLEITRKKVVHRMLDIIVPVGLATKLTMALSPGALAAGVDSADKIRRGFHDIIDVFTALAEPILWFYALTACVLIATKNKNAGWERLKNVGYAYAGIALLPTFFSFLRWVSSIVSSSITF
ncbi:hypothetical protein [Bacillus phage SP8]|nr:hypothetical protein [Bacillus phage SP8]